MRPIRFASPALVFCLAFSLAGPRPAGAGDQPVVISDLLRLRTAGGIDVAPNGARAVYVVTSMHDDGETGYRRHLWLADTTGVEPPRQLTFGARNDRGPVFSPDGTRIAFVRRRDDEPQVFVLPLAGGEAFAVTQAEHGASDPAWSPDGSTIAFTSEVPIADIDGALPWPYERAGRSFRDVAIDDTDDSTSVEPDPDGDLAALRAWLAKNAADESPRVLTRLDFQDERGLASDLTFTHVFASPATAGAVAVQLTDGFQDFSDPAWMPDGDSLVVASAPYPEHPDRIRDGDLWRVAADGSESASLLDWPGWIAFAPVPSPDGSRIAFLASDQDDPSYSLTHLAVVAADGSAPRRLASDLDRTIDSAPVWSDDGTALYVRSRDRGSFPLLHVDLTSGNPATVVGDGPLGVRDADVAGGRLVYALTEVANPNELYAAATDGTNALRLTALNSGWLADKRIVHPEERWTERDDRRIQYWVMRPPEADTGPIPTVLEIHGGPSAMWGPGEFTMWHELQVLAGRGFGVVYSNPRGSSGYGYDHRHANFRDWGHGPAGDILASLDAASAENGWIDPDRLVVTGGSYAGYMTAWIVTQDHRFQAAVAQRGVYELSFFFGEGNAWRLVPYHFGGFPWEEEARRFLDANSPMTFVDQIETPLLVMHADQDLRTGVNQSELLVKSLKALGKPVEYVRYPDEGHDLSRSGNPKRRMDRIGRIVELFERYVSRPSAGTP